MQGENHRAGCNLIPPLQPVKDNLGYSTYITDVPPPIIGEMCRLLDIERVTDENDYRMLGYELGLKSQMRMIIECWDMNLALNHQRSPQSNKKVTTHRVCY